MDASARRHAPATLRNREPLLAVLRRVLPPRGVVLEVASGTGEHAAFFAAALPDVVWQPTDHDAGARASIDAWRGDAANVRAALALDASAPDTWPLAHADAMLCVNMIHIAPWTACAGLLAGAGRVLPEGAPLVLYGPYRVGGAHTAPSNAAFDAGLRGQDPSWGVRDLEAVIAAAAPHGLRHVETVAMPANNLTVVLRRA